MNALEHKVPPPIVVMLLGASMWAASRLATPLPILDAWRLGIAIPLIAAGLVITGLGVAAFGRAGTTINPVKLEEATALVTGGLFRLTRNPMYVGFATLLLGWAVGLATPWAFLGPVAFVLFITRFQIIPEERVMMAKFGPAYADYRGKVRRWL